MPITASGKSCSLKNACNSIAILSAVFFFVKVSHTFLTEKTLLLISIHFAPKYFSAGWRTRGHNFIHNLKLPLHAICCGT